jgi:hypothetical protein
MTTLTATTEQMVSVETFKWLIQTNDPAADSASISRISKLIDNGIDGRHIRSVFRTSMPGTLMIECSSEAVCVLQQQAWIVRIKPHPAQIKAYEIPIVERMSAARARRELSKLNHLIDEMMLNEDIIKITRKPGYLYVISTPRGIKFLSDVIFLGIAVAIK